MLVLNLKAEMLRHQISQKDIQEFLGCSESTLRKKLNGYSQFTMREAVAIRNKFFPDMTIDYLFAQ